MENMPTQQKILQEALLLFSEKGYSAVSMAQIANAVGIKAPSLYKHYTGKQDIFDAIVREMETRYEKQAALMQMNGSVPGEDAALFQHMEEEQLLEMGKALFLYFLHDEFMARFRKMLTIEQFTNPQLAQLYTRQYVRDPLAYQGTMISILIQAGVFRAESADMMALHFYAPLYLLLTLCDRQPQQEPWALVTVEQHIRQFSRLYKKEGMV